MLYARIVFGGTQRLTCSQLSCILEPSVAALFEDVIASDD